MTVQPSVQLLRDLLGKIATSLILAPIAAPRAYRRIRLAPPRMRMARALAVGTLLVGVLLESGLRVSPVTVFR